MRMGAAGLELTTLDEAWRFAKYVSVSGLAPKGITSPEAIVVALQMGREVGLPPMASLQNIAVINGRPSIWGDAQLAVCRNTGEVEIFEEWFESGGKRLPRNPVTYADDTVAVCRIKRRGFEPSETGFSVADAKAANLWGKDGPWKQYPFRMLKFRARSFALRDQFGDALKGLRAAEEVMDDPVEAAKPATPGIDAPKFSRKPKADPAATTPAPEIVVQSEPTPEAAPEPANSDAPAPTEMGELQSRFAEFCTDAGVSIEDALSWLKSTGRWPQADDATSFADIPEAVLTALLGAKNDLAKMVKVFGKVVGK